MFSVTIFFVILFYCSCQLRASCASERENCDMREKLKIERESENITHTRKRESLTNEHPLRVKKSSVMF